METNEQQPSKNDRRFQIELEFIQCLANPWYLNNLAQQQYFKDEAFIRYLEYLQYWKQPEYAKFIVYPHALYFLDLLQHEQFREHVSTSDNTQEIHRMQYYHWMYLRNPPKEQQQSSQQQQQQQQLQQLQDQGQQSPSHIQQAQQQQQQQ